MREIIIKEKEAGQRLDKFLKKYLKEAPASFFYKMLRKKNIVLNGKKAEGKEKLAAGDCVKFFLSDETMEKFSGRKERSVPKTKEEAGILPDLVYEDEQVLLINKPAGLLSQKANAGDISLVEAITFYLIQSGQLKEEELHTFRPAVCNRLDRNTSGLVAAGKSLAALRMLNQAFRERSIEKWYLCIVKGCIRNSGHIRGRLTKDERTNQVKILVADDLTASGTKIETAYEPVAWNREMTLLSVHLITGKTHQIRAHLSHMGHPILGDPKYGDSKFNLKYRKESGIKYQLLHAYSLTFPVMGPPLQKVSQKTFRAPVPADFWKIIKETTWQHGIQEALEVLH